MGGAPKPPPVFFCPPSPEPPTSPPSKTPALPPPPPRRPHSPLPPPPPLPPGFFPSSSPLPLPPQCCLPTMPPPPPGAGATAPAGAFPYPGGSRSPKGGRFVEHLAHGRRVSVTAPAREDDLAGVPPELLPLKKRIVRYHPYAAAAAIQEMASHRNHGGGGFLLAVDVVPAPTTGARLDLAGERDEGGLRAELLRLRIMRPALVLTKQLTFSDRSRDHARLLLPDGLVAPSPLLGMLTPAERRLVFGAGLPVPAFDRLGRAYRMSLRRDPKARTYRLMGQWSLFVSRHHMRAGDAVEVRAFRPSAWQARLDKHGEGGLGMALLHRRDDAQGYRWCDRERDAADGLLRMAASASPAAAAVA